MVSAMALACLGLPCGAQSQAQQPGSGSIRSNTTEVRKSSPAPATALRPTLAEPESVALDPSRGTVLAATISGSFLQPKIVLSVSGDVRLRAFVLADPYRVVIEGQGLAFVENFALILPVGSLLADYRFGQLGADRGRLVVETIGPVRLGSLELGPATLDGSLSASVAVIATSRAAVLALQAEAPLTLDMTGALSISPALPQAGSSVKPVIMIDPGHGGRDPGAVADGGALEKDVVLARRLKTILAASGRYDLRMTRDADVAVTLGQRVAASTAAQASLFISLHADTFSGQPLAAAVRGGSVYVLSDRASNGAAQALAEKENTADVRAGLDLTPDAGKVAVDSFLSDLMARETQTFATDFQASLIKTLRGAMTLAREPARAASFQVLKQPGAPAVLVELGYMSHAQDIGLLQAPEWQSQVASAIARAVDAHFAAPRQIVGRR
jgi:N-acetylmuramoyl-L-alanine amidase